MNHFIIATHSYLANGFKASVEFFFRDLDNVTYLNAYIDEENFEDEFFEVIDQHLDKNLVILTDLAGGSVTQSAAKKLVNNKFILISGVNLGLVFSLITKTDEINYEIVREAINEAKNDICFINDVLEIPEER